MLYSPRIQALSQIPDQDRKKSSSPYLRLLPHPNEQLLARRSARKMLLVHQSGSVKVGEVVRYTITYTPNADRVIPSPANIHVRVKNTSAIPLRAAYLNGPYALHVAAFPISFEPNNKFQNAKRNGTPQFETNLKAGSSFSARLVVPEDMRVTGLNPKGPEAEEQKSVSWIVEIASQMLFSNSAHVKFELLLGRDDKSLDFNFTTMPSTRHAEAGEIQDHQSPRKRRNSNSGQPKGVYSRAISLTIDDTDSLWNRPALPIWEKPKTAEGRKSLEQRRQGNTPLRPRHMKKKKIHLVIVTHGLHSNLGADMLYMKESIDATVKAARESTKQRKAGSSRSEAKSGETHHDGVGNAERDNKDVSTAPLSGGQEDMKETDNEIDDDDEQVIVRGFPGNATKTEKGIQYLGKRLARYILDLTYPDQPVRFVKKKSISQKLSDSLSSRKNSEGDKDKDKDKKKTHSAETLEEGLPSHDKSRIRQEHTSAEELAYTFTSISFIGHSLGGLIQVYAMAYIQKHAPAFFDQIKPVNFVTMAAPMLGLSNENPMYVKFALDFGLVGRTGQDLGLTWRAPTLARTGWTAMVGGFGGGHDDHSKEDPRAKPLLRVLPTGPAHIVLRKFRNRTLYSNIVNDGIVPLRTSCLLFLDWRGLDKIGKARREAGLVGTMLSWGWAEMTGQNAVDGPALRIQDNSSDSDSSQPDKHDGQSQHTVPQPSDNAVNEDDRQSIRSVKTSSTAAGHKKRPHFSRAASKEEMGPFETIWSYLRPSGKTTKRDLRMIKRSQTLGLTDSDQNMSQSDSHTDNETNSNRPKASRIELDEDSDDSKAPPKTTIFESAADLLSPPTPPMAWILDPSARPRTIVHDRVYHPEDIPPPPMPRRRVGSSTPSLDSRRSTTSGDSNANGAVRVEEKIARAYHRDLSWRKVLVRLEPDAHNNMIVRRMFANAYGWPVVKHLCDTHFGDNYSANTRDEFETAHERAQPTEQPIGPEGERVAGQQSKSPPKKPEQLLRQTTDELGPLREQGTEHVAQKLQKTDSIDDDDSYLENSDEENEDEEEQPGPFQKLWSGAGHNKRPSKDETVSSNAGIGPPSPTELHKHGQYTVPDPMVAPGADGGQQPGELNRSMSISEQIIQNSQSEEAIKGS